VGIAPCQLFFIFLRRSQNHAKHDPLRHLRQSVQDGPRLSRASQIGTPTVQPVIGNISLQGDARYDLPDYWREELSFAFANVPLTPLNEGKADDTADDTGNVLANLNDAEMKRRVLEMRRDGMSQTKIAGVLGVGRKRIRTALDGVEGPTS